MSRYHPNYPRTRKGKESVHHASYPASAYPFGEYHDYRHARPLLLPVENRRHNLGAWALHSVIDTTIGYPIKPHINLARIAMDFMHEIPDTKPRIQQFGDVIDFYQQFSEESPFYQLADQARDLAYHYEQQKFVIEHGGQAWVQAQREAA